MPLTAIWYVPAGVPPAATAPVPESATTCGLFDALSVMVRLPERTPVCVGVNVTEIAQPAPPATAEPQLFVCEKSPAVVMLAIDKLPPPVFVSVTGCGALGDCSSWLPNVRLVGDTEAAGTPGVGVGVVVGVGDAVGVGS